MAKLRIENLWKYNTFPDAASSFIFSQMKRSCSNIPCLETSDQARSNPPNLMKRGEWFMHDNRLSVGEGLIQMYLTVSHEGVKRCQPWRQITIAQLGFYSLRRYCHKPSTEIKDHILTVKQILESWLSRLQLNGLAISLAIGALTVIVATDHWFECTKAWGT